MLEKLREKNAQLLAWFKGEQNRSAIHRQELLKVLLADDVCFFRLDIDDSLAILRDLGLSPDEVTAAYRALTSPEAFIRVKHLMA